MMRLFGSFLADGDRANQFRFREVESVISDAEMIVFDFSGVENMTDSFANACFGNLAANHANDLLAKVRFANCQPTVRAFLQAAVSLGLATSAHRSAA